MRMRSARVPQIAKEMISALVSAGDIETESPNEVTKDVEAVLMQYIRDEEAITDKAREMVAARGLPASELARTKRLVADQRKVKLGDEAIDYVLDQLLEMLMHSGHVDEIYAEDYQLRRKLRVPLRHEEASEEALQSEVRGRLKHVKEGTSVWEVEYQRMMDDIKRRKGL